MKRIKKSLYAYIDNELSESKRKAVEENINESASTGQYYKEIQNVNRMLDSYTELEFSPELKSTILDAVKGRVIDTNYIKTDISQYHLWETLKKDFISLSSAAMIFLALTIGFFIGNDLLRNNDDRDYDYLLSDNSFSVVYEQIIEDSDER